MMRIICSGQVIDLRSLGQPIDDAFVAFYGASLGTSAFSWLEFEAAVGRFFDREDVGAAEHNCYFENFSILWRRHLATGQFEHAEELWRQAVGPAINWEQAHPERRIHKGTAFYFWGATAILRGDLDRGYSLMHQAVEEDSQLVDGAFPDTPASALVTLNAEKPDQAFRTWVVAKATLLEEFLAAYRGESGSTLAFSHLRRRFLSQPPSRHISVLFAYVLARMLKLNAVPPYALNTPFASQLKLNLLFDVALVIDAAIKAKHPDPATWRFIDLAEHLSNAAALGISRPDLQAANQRFSQDFVAAAEDLFANGFQLQGGGIPSPQARNLLLAYGIRNFGAHHVASPSIIGNRSAEFRNGLFGTLFTVVERLY